jgi:hypothetical protein
MHENSVRDYKEQLQKKDDSHKEQLKAQADSHKEQLKAQADSHNREIQRMENLYRERKDEWALREKKFADEIASLRAPPPSPPNPPPNPRGTVSTFINSNFFQLY